MIENPPIKLIFKYQNKEYPIEYKESITFVWWEEELSEWDWYWWLDGNGACDCNRSLTIRKYYPEFKILEKCGGEIELIDYQVI